MESVRHNENIITIKSFWTDERCDCFVHKSENIGYEPALVNTERGQQRIEGVRNNQRVLLTDYSLAHEMWGSLCKYAPPILGNSEAVGLNEMFRFYKYEPGQEFKKHRDQSFIRNEVEASYFTMMIYLNDGFEGGETTFDNLRIKPKKGMCLIFFHDLEHEGTKLKSGVKYVLRTDIMYKLKE